MVLFGFFFFFLPTFFFFGFFPPYFLSWVFCAGGGGFRQREKACQDREARDREGEDVERAGDRKGALEGPAGETSFSAPLIDDAGRVEAEFAGQRLAKGLGLALRHAQPEIRALGAGKRAVKTSGASEGLAERVAVVGIDAGDFERAAGEGERCRRGRGPRGGPVAR